MSASASVDLLRLLAAFAQIPTPTHKGYAHALGMNVSMTLEDWRIAHTDAFIAQCPPYASIYVGERGHIGGDAADRVAGFRGLLGADVTKEPDHLAALLLDYAELADRSSTDARARHARAAMLWEQLLCWLMPYLHALQRCAPTPYDQWAEMVRDVFLLEAETIAPDGPLPLHLRQAPSGTGRLAEADSVDALIRELLIPSATGVVFARRDLVRAAHALQISFVQHTRAFMLHNLLDHNVSATLGWLAEEARMQACARTDEQQVLGETARFWSQRAEITADALDVMATHADTDAAGQKMPCSG